SAEAGYAIPSATSGGSAQLSRTLLPRRECDGWRSPFTPRRCAKHRRLSTASSAVATMDSRAVRSCRTPRRRVIPNSPTADGEALCETPAVLGLTRHLEAMAAVGAPAKDWEWPAEVACNSVRSSRIQQLTRRHSQRIALSAAAVST